MLEFAHGVTRRGVCVELLDETGATYAPGLAFRDRMDLDPRGVDRFVGPATGDPVTVIGGPERLDQPRGGVLADREYTIGQVKAQSQLCISVL